MYIPKTKFRVEDSLGNDYTNSTGQPYVGKILRTSSGRVFAGSSINNIQGTLNKVQDSNLTRIERPFNDYYGPTQQDYNQGFYVRYFIRDKRDGKFTEVNLDQWKQKRRLPYVTSGKLIWSLRGPANDGEINGVPFTGASTKNKERLQISETEFPGINNFFKSTSEFVR